MYIQTPPPWPERSLRNILKPEIEGTERSSNQVSVMKIRSYFSFEAISCSSAIFSALSDVAFV
jgi:hypothetical protein